MSLLDLSLVTRTVTTLLGERIPMYSDWPAANTLLASGGAPDLVNAPHGLSFYLYHVKEDAHTKSQDWQVSDAVPQRFKPMGLTLYYVMTPKSNLADPHQRAMAEQLMMGLALKTLRDQPVLDDTSFVMTTGGPVIVMPTPLRGRNNRLRLQLQPTPPNEATQYWQTGSQPMRLSAYYEVAATLLEPDEPTTRAGRVLMVGVHTLVRGQPRLEKTQSEVTFTVPGETTPRSITLSPAEVGVGQTLSLIGADLKSDNTSLLLNHRDFVAPVEVDTAWNLTTNGSEMTVAVQSTAGAQVLIPGIYGAIVKTVARRTLPDGSQRDFDAYSNESVLAIVPVIASSTEAAGIVTLKMQGFEPHALSANELLVFLGNTKLTRITTTPPGVGEYVTPSTAGNTDEIRFRFPAGTVSGSVLPLRIIVRGAESSPRWEVAP